MRCPGIIYRMGRGPGCCSVCNGGAVSALSAVCSDHIWSTVNDTGDKGIPHNKPPQRSAATTAFSYSFSTSLIMSHYPEVSICLV